MKKKFIALVAVLALFGVAITGFLSPQKSIVSTNVISPVFNDIAGLGSVSNYSAINVLGFNGDVDSAEDVWSYGGDYTYISTAEAIYVSSSNANASGSLSIDGLDASYARQTKTISWTGTTKTVVAGTRIRVFDAKYTGPETLSGTVYVYTTGTVVTTGVPQTASYVKASMTADTNISLKGMYTVPVSYYGLIDSVSANVYNSTGNADVTVFVKNFGEQFATKFILSPSLYQNNTVLSFNVPVYVAPKSDIKIRVTGVTATNADVSSSIEMKIVR